MKFYTQVHKSKKALNNHIAKIEARGGNYFTNGSLSKKPTKITYWFPTDIKGMKLIGSKKGFDVYFNTNKQEYIVYKDMKFFADGFSKKIDIKSYLE